MMKYLFDSSVLVAALAKHHPMHDRAISWVQKARSGDIQWIIASHSLAEIYSALTTLPITPRISPVEAVRLINENIPRRIVTPLTTDDYTLTLNSLSQLGLSGGIIYDALIVRIALKSKADRIITFNIRHFKQV